jgi:insertion element IS1 protein InsB
VTQVDRETRCIVNWRVLEVRSEPAFQAMVDESPQAQQYYSDAFGVYDQLIYDPAQHQALPDKSQTYSVEGCNADLRHYLARLARRSRCFSRCLDALRRAIKIFVFAWNRRQLFKRKYPTYPAHVRDFVYP